MIKKNLRGYISVATMIIIDQVHCIIIELYVKLVGNGHFLKIFWKTDSGNTFIEATF